MDDKEKILEETTYDNTLVDAKEFASWMKREYSRLDAGDPVGKPRYSFKNGREDLTWGMRRIQTACESCLPPISISQQQSGLWGRVLPATSTSCSPILFSGGLSKITDSPPGYGSVPQGGSAWSGRAATLDLLAVRNFPYMTASLTGTTRHVHVLGNPFPHNWATQTLYIFIPDRINYTTGHGAECKP